MEEKDGLKSENGKWLLESFRKSSWILCFLEKCKLYNLTPKFVRFKLYKRQLRRENFYKDWQQQLLDRELKEKRRKHDQQYKILFIVMKLLKVAQFF